MASLNRVFLMGNLTHDPELRHTSSGTAVTDLGLAVNRRYTNGEGQTKEETLFITVVVWGKQAGVMAEYLAKGSLVHVEGRLHFRSWEAKDGGRRTTIEVVADRVQFLSRRPGPAESADSAPEGETSDKEVPF